MTCLCRKLSAFSFAIYYYYEPYSSSIINDEKIGNFRVPPRYRYYNEMKSLFQSKKRHRVKVVLNFYY